VIAALKAADKTRNIPVIFISGLGTPEDEEKGLLLGAADYISKPFSAVIVKLRVRSQIQILNYLAAVKNLNLTDQLTGLPNRRSFDERLHVEWKRAVRVKAPISILILDLDSFKAYNDTYGHVQGDVLLHAVANILMQELKRPTDFAARWGGEEFVALLSSTDWTEAVNLAEQIRMSIANAVIPLADGQATKTTISIGVNSQMPAPGDLTDDFILRADKALYTAKEEGRNRVCRYSRC
jgi:diguanylate cyclase (GGDEF)-like protein